jgi:chromate reductase
MKMEKLKILGFAGSLRKASYNKVILRAAAELVPQNAVLEIFDLDGIPPFNEDLESNPPAKVTEFKAKLKAADAILIATPEYNYSMPGVLKNALDWASRPYGDNSCDDKPLAIMGASIGAIATARAQYHLRQTCVVLNMHPINKPEVMVGVVQDKVDKNNTLTDERTKEIIKSMLLNLVIWTQRLKQK